MLLHVLPRASHWLLPADANQVHLLDGIAQVGAVLLVGVTGTQYQDSHHVLLTRCSLSLIQVGRSTCRCLCAMASPL